MEFHRIEIPPAPSLPPPAIRSGTTPEPGRSDPAPSGERTPGERMPFGRGPGPRRSSLNRGAWRWLSCGWLANRRVSKPLTATTTPPGDRNNPMLTCRRLWRFSRVGRVAVMDFAWSPARERDRWEAFNTMTLSRRCSWPAASRWRRQPVDRLTIFFLYKLDTMNKKSCDPRFQTGLGRAAGPTPTPRPP